MPSARERFVALGEVVGVCTLFLILGRFGLVTPRPATVYITLFVVGATMATIVNDFFAARTTCHTHLRLAVNVGVAASVMYTSGWGPMLLIGFMFITNDAVKQRGPTAAWPAFGWSLAAILFGQLAIQIGLAPSMLAPPAVHGLAVLGIVGLGFGVNTLSISSTAEQKANDHLVFQAYHDTLTGHWNRAAFLLRLDGAIGSTQPHHMVSVLFLDLDDFKTVNDSLGHMEGDRLLVEAATRLRSCLEADDVLARLGGDEFAVLLCHDHRRSPELIAQELLASLEAPFELSTEQVFVRASVGIVSRATDAHGPGAAEQVLRDADVALYSAKAEGKGTYAQFRPAMHAAAVERLALSADLRRAIEREDFALAYQPTVVLETGEVVGVEALVRWHSADRGLVMPGDFIPRAEETGLIVPLGRWVLSQACQQTSAWKRHHPMSSLTVSVNLSARQLSSPTLVRDVEAALEESGLGADSLILEITESFLLDDEVTSVTRLNELKRLGVRLAIDDFGTGYSSLSYLRRYPIDVLKIDKSFVDAIVTDPDSAALVDAILLLGRTLHLETVAEGIEHERQLLRIREGSCDLGQGYYFARPGPLGIVLEKMSNLATGEDVLRGIETRLAGPHRARTAFEELAQPAYLV